MTEKQYAKLVAEMNPKSPMGKDAFNAFWIGGAICTLGQVFQNLYSFWGLEEKTASLSASLTLICLSALLTGLSWCPLPALPIPSQPRQWNSKPRATSLGLGEKCSPLPAL